MTGRGGFLFLLGLFILSMFEVFVKAHSEDEHDADEFRKEFGDEPQHDSFSQGTKEEHIEVRDGPQFGSVKQKPLVRRSLPTLKFLFCVSCGYKQAYEQFSMAVREKYPEMPIEGSNYPPAKWKEYLAHAINILKITAIAAIVSGSNPFQLIGLGEPSIMQWAHSNKISACMMLFLLTNMVESALMSTGAFEIYLDKDQIWSKLESGRVPSPQELIQMIDSQLELTGRGYLGGAGFGDFNQ
ncbi:selT/selW/selH selenoprotein [Cooperia oncophora]